MFVTALLVLATWLLCLLVITGTGLAVLPRRDAKHTRAWALDRFRAGLWIGLAVLTALVLAVNLGFPLRGTPAVFLGLGSLLAAGLGFWRFRHVLPAMAQGRGAGLLAWLVPAGFGIGVVVLAIQALGMPINYDAGLYQLNAVSYAREFPTIPGLANLHDRLGFNSSLYPLAAVLGNGLWTDQGFRLVTGLFIVAMVAEVVLRIVNPRQQRSIGTLVVAVCAAFTVGYALIEPGRLVASPVADMTSVPLIVVSLSALADLLRLRRAQSGSGVDTPAPSGSQTANLVVAMSAAAVAATMRPLGWVVVLMAVILLAVRSRGLVVCRSGTIALILTAGLGLLMLIRDVILSGWLLFPMSLAPMPVDWRLPDPGTTSAAITAWARAPHQDPELTGGWGWLAGWVLSLRTDWAVAAALAMLFVAGIGWVTLRMRQVSGPVLMRPAALALVPAVVPLALWWWTAPDPRFAWGLILICGAVPLALVTGRFRRGPTLVLAGSTTLLLMLAVVGFARGSFIPVGKDLRPLERQFGGQSVTLMLAPVKEVPIREVMLTDGTRTLEPISDLQCWQAFPLCRLPGSPDNIRSRGSDITDGFRPR